MQPHFTLFLLLLTVQISAQNKFYLGLTGGQGTAWPYESTQVSRINNYAAGMELGYQLVSNLYFTARPEYQYRYFLNSQPNAEAGRSLQFVTSHFSLQWKGRWGYAGAGITASKMLDKREENILPMRCGVGLDDEHLYEPPSVYTDYSSSGVFFQVGLTPPISAHSRAVLELNAAGEGVRSLTMPSFRAYGFRLGIQRHFTPQSN